MRGFFKIHYAESIFRIGDNIGDFGCGLLRVSPYPAKRGDVRAPGEKSKEGTTVVGKRRDTRHSRLFYRSGGADGECRLRVDQSETAGGYIHS